MRKLFKILLSGLLIAGNTSFVYAEETEASDANEIILETEDLDPESLHVSKLGETDGTPAVEEATVPWKLSDSVRVSIVLDDASAMDAGYSMQNVADNQSAVDYRAQLKAKQDAVTQAINQVLAEPIEVKWNLTLAVNIISANVKYGDIEKIRRVEGVKDVFMETQYEIHEDEISTANTSSNMVGATTAWNLGYSGAGTRIAIIDTGIDTTHQSFNADAFSYSIGLLNETDSLMTKSDVSAVASQLNSKSSNYVSTKIPYGYNYVDGNTTINHLSDTQGEHGSHVAGIAAANRYIKSGTSYNDAASTVQAVGMAPDAQLLIMKVFGSSGGAYDSDYMSAIEDAVVLGCDSVNLSLGSSAPGFTYAGEYQDVLNSLSTRDDMNLVVTISAGNAGPFTEALSTDLYIDDVYMHTGGSPGSFINSLGVASANNIGATGAPLTFNGNQTVFYTESDSSGAAMTSIAGTYSYVYIDATGSSDDYSAVNSAVSLNGKMVIVNRGDLSFYEKGNNAVSYKPKALLVANNQSGVIAMDLTDYTGTFPMASITLADAETIKANSTKKTTGSYTYYTGTVTVTDSMQSGVTADRADTEVSEFSSWGVPGSLIMKPEITAPGGNIYSVYGTNKTSTSTAGGSDKYELMSGTSMAAPHMAGLSALLAQYLKDQNISVDGYSMRALNQSLLMSTATPMINDGQYVSILQQGSGLAEVSKAISASSVIMMNENDNTLTAKTGSASDGKVKAELGDNPTRNEPYTYSFTIYNLNNQDVEYSLNTELFTQAQYTENGEVFMSPTTTKDLISNWNITYAWGDVSGAEAHDANKDGFTSENDVQAILDYAVAQAAGIDYEGTFDTAAADLNSDSKVTTADAYELIEWLKFDHSYAAGTVPAKGSRKVQVTITPDHSLDAYYPSGAYVEGFTYVNAETKSSDGGSIDVEHSIPILGFYGSWTDPSMFDNTSYIDTLYGTAKTAYSGNTDTNYMTLQYNGSSAKFSGNPYKTEETFPEDRLAINSSSQIDSFAYNLIRSAGTTGFAVSKTDSLGGNVTDVLSSAVLGSAVTGQWYNEHSAAWQNTATKYYSLKKAPSSYGLNEGDTFRIGFYAVPEYYGMLVSSDMTAADAGYLSGSSFANVLKKNVLGKGALIGYDFTVDNTAPVVSEATLSGNTLTVKANDNANLAYLAVLSLDGNTAYAEAIPGTDEYTISFDASDAIAKAAGYVAVFAGDYAGNEAAKAVKVNNNASSTDPYTVSNITLTPTSLDLYKNAEANLNASVTPLTASDTKVNWTSSNTSVATVDASGHVTAVGAGSATITASANADSSIKATCSVKVTSVDKNLNGIVWDENGDVYFSSFNASTLPSWTKLHNTSAGKELVSAIYTNSTLYAGDLDSSAGTSTLYTVNTSSYALTEVGAFAYFAVDLAPTYTSGRMVQVYGPYVMVDSLSDPSGGFYSYKDLTSYLGDETYLAGIAAKSLSRNSSAYYVLDESGIIWQLTMNSSGSFGNPTKVVETGISTSFMYQSLYYDGTYLYWSHQDGDTNELIIINPSTKAIYHAGNFGENVWPVGGLYVNGQTAPASEEEIMEANEPFMTDVSIDTESVNRRLFEEAAKMGRTQAEGSLNNVHDFSTAAKKTPAVTELIAPVKLTAAETENTGDNVSVSIKEESTALNNGLYKIAYTPSVMTYVSSASNADYSSVYADTVNGMIYAAFADEEGIAAGSNIETITFTKPETSAQVTVSAVEKNTETPSEESEIINIGNDDEVISGYKFSHSTSFGNNLRLYYYAPKAGLEGYENFRLEVKKQVHEADGTISWKSYEITDYTDAESNGTAYYKFAFSNIAAKEMGDELVAVLHCEKDGKEYYTEEDTYSVKTYAYNRLAASDSNTFRTLMVDMLNYGAAAQVYFGYNTKELVNAQLSDEQKAYGTADMPELSSCDNTINKDGATASFKYRNVIFNSNIELKYYMDLAEVESLENVKLQLTYTTATGREEVTKIGSEAFGYDESTKCYTAKLSTIAAKDLDSKVTAVILEGNTEISGVMEYSIESYAENRLKQSTDANFKALLEELMKYGFSAKKYSESKNS